MTPDNGGRESARWFERAQEILPGGVNSPVRAFKSVGGTPPFISHGAGSRLWDVDGREYIDFVMSYGPLLLGHAPEPVVEALRLAAGRGTVYGAPTPGEVEIGERVSAMMPAVEMVRFVNSGTEATGSAIRLARGFTGRRKVIKCAGCFHGSVDSLLVAGGSGIATLGIPDTAGVPAELAAETIVVEYNDGAGLRAAFEKFGGEIAAFILEPVAANMGVVPPRAGYLELARELTAEHGSLLIFDEVISGFRLGAGGACGLYGVTPDLVCLGKVLGGGVPCAAYGGRRDVMEMLAPVGPVYQAGTLSGNPLATGAGLAMLREIERRGSGLYERIDGLAERLAAGLSAAAERLGVPLTVQRVGSLLTPFFGVTGKIEDYPGARRADTALFERFFHGMLGAGIYIPPSQFEAWFVSDAHTAEDIDRTVEVARAVLAKIS